jgi:ribonuclease G
MPAQKEIIVNAEDKQTRIAIVEDGELVELYIENPDNKRTIGNLYLGRVRKVMPSIKAAFVDIGQEQDAFLHFSDLSDNLPQLLQLGKMNAPRVEKIDLPKSDDGGSSKRASDYLKRGQQLLVQITKEPISTKGSRITTDLSMAGRFLVLVPLSRAIAVSRKIEKAKERRRLKALASSLVPENFGVIVRTVAEGRDAKSLDTDLKLLMERWRRVEKRLARGTRPPALVHEDVDMASSIIRDQFSSDYARILIDEEGLYHSVRSYVRAVAPKMAERVQLHKSSTPVFEATEVQRGAERAFQERVELPSGGYLFIERTEAMHVVDVNSGRSGRGMSQRQNSLKVNLEAARAIVQQVRLRDIGGIIVVDFIDLRDEKHRRKVYDALKEGFQDDRAVTKILPMSDFGLIEITRQRLRPSLTTTFASSNGEVIGSGTGGGGDGASRSSRGPSKKKKSGGRRSRRRGGRRRGGREPSADAAQEHRREAERLRKEVERLKRRLSDAEAAAEKAAEEAAEAAAIEPPDEADAVATPEVLDRINAQRRKAEAQRGEEAERRRAAERARDEAQAEVERLREETERLERDLDRQRRAADEAQAAADAAQEAAREAAAAAPEATASPDALVDAVERWVTQYKGSGRRRAVTLRVHPFAAAYLHRPVPDFPTRWFMRHLVRVRVEADPSVPPLAYRCVDAFSGETLHEDALAKA